MRGKWAVRRVEEPRLLAVGLRWGVFTPEGFLLAAYFDWPRAIKAATFVAALVGGGT